LNLQIVSVRVNLSKDKKNKSSKYTGVCWNKRCKKWTSQIYYKGKIHIIGFYKDEEIASTKYQEFLQNIKNKQDEKDTNSKSNRMDKRI